MGTEKGGNRYGTLTIEIDHNGCGLRKTFSMLKNAFSYATLGYFDAQKAHWVEAYTFSNGEYAIYNWIKDESDFLLKRVQPESAEDLMMHNRWTKPLDGRFQIITEQSSDGGKTWVQTSVTNMVKME